MTGTTHRGAIAARMVDTLERRMMRLLPDILQARAADQPDDCAYVFLDERGAEAELLTYSELHFRAMAVAAYLRERCAQGDRVILMIPPGLDFVVAYVGCLYAHVIAVPVSPPRNHRIHDATRNIIADCDPAMVLTSLDDVDPDGTLEPDRCDAASIAFLQYTSGSTSAPKGVMVSHGNLAANQEQIQRAMGHDEESTFVGWAPLFHDQGLIGNVLQPLHLGATSYLMSPGAFIRRPLLWLSAISKYRAHSSGGPNFAFDVCVAHAQRRDLSDLDLSSWRVAFNGAEPIRPESLRRFAETFAPYGFDANALYPCYGLAEATLFVSGSRKGRGPRYLDADRDELGRGHVVPGQGRTLVGSGVPEADIRIVDPHTRQPSEPHRIGEIWVAGEQVAQGYWNGRSPDTFADGYLHTGDLGVVIDEELYVVGRVKDLIIIRGRNVYPHDIELTAQSAHPLVRPGACAAFAISGVDTDRLVVVAEVREERPDIAGAIRAAIIREHEVAVADLVLSAPGRLQKTSSGKIMRSAAKKCYLEGGFDVDCEESRV
ncbi:fatty acyl-AMP ligase [Rhodococcus jostii]|nr:fatty acyl-AMP ligase [Rhodococcus jostii]